MDVRDLDSLVHPVITLKVSSRWAGLLFVWSLLLLVPQGVQAQERVLAGWVLDAESGVALSGALLVAGPTGPTAITDGRGRFRLIWRGADTLDVDSDSLHVRLLGYRPARIPIQASLFNTESYVIRLQAAPLRLSEVTITATREARERSELPIAVDRIDESTISRINPAHPSRIANRIPGVWINATEGEGHMTAIRQPLSLLPQYLFLENGIPTRSTGFFNHNALFEVNIPQASAVEIIKGPGTALYGSDAIGGVINVETGSIPSTSGGSVTLEGGSFGFKRVLASMASVGDTDSYRVDINGTTSTGWRRGTEYDRFSGTVSWQRSTGAASRLRTVATWTEVRQNPAGIAAISTEDYLEDPRTHYTPVSYRDVSAVRVSSVWERWDAQSLLSITPFFRYSRMELLPNWALSFDPATWETSNWSLGAQARYRRVWPERGLRWIAGLDLDLSPGHRTEREVIAEQVDRLFVSVEPGALQYDYDVTFAQAAPFMQMEWEVSSWIRANAGLRFDLASFDYENQLTVLEEGRHKRPASQRVSYQQLSPKFGIVARPLPSATVFASWRHAFRVPSERQVFRQGAARSSIGLKPVRAENLEAGVRWQAGSVVYLDVTAFQLSKADDIVTFNYPDGSRGSVNTGETKHRGVETGLTVEAGGGLTLHVAWTRARHTYEAWVTELDQDFSGNEMELAPRNLIQAEASWTAPWLEDVEWALEMHRVGSYWMNPDNTVQYDGHALLHARVFARISDTWALMGRVGNLRDTLYAQRALTNAFRGDEWAPGLPRSVNVALRASF